VIRWTYAFVDRPWDSYERARTFWAAVSASTLSAPRGDDGQFATLLPSAGHPALKTQAVGGPAGTHLDLCVDDVPALVERATGLGARTVAVHDGYTVLGSPAGVVFCAIGWHGETERPPVVTAPDGARSRVDQVCLDIPAAAFDAEVPFWEQLTGWASRPGALPEFHVLAQPVGLPLRLLVQRLDSDRPAGAHLDLACSDTAVTRAWHESLGATLVARRPHWTVLADPAGAPYCLTLRDPDTGIRAW
jgi:Glyoxalase-like domain